MRISESGKLERATKKALKAQFKSYLFVSGTGTGWGNIQERNPGTRNISMIIDGIRQITGLKERLEKATVFHVNRMARLGSWSERTRSSAFECLTDAGMPPYWHMISSGSCQCLISYADSLLRMREYPSKVLRPLWLLMAWDLFPANRHTLFYSTTVCANLALQSAFIISLCTAIITGSPRKCLADTNRLRVYLELPPLDPLVIKNSCKLVFLWWIFSYATVGVMRLSNHQSLET